MKTKDILKMTEDCLKFSVSKEETRPYLMGYYHCPETYAIYATNGYVMTCSKHRYFYSDDFAGKIIDAKFPHHPINREYPGIKPVFDLETFKGNKTLKMLTVPKYYKLKSSKIPVKAYIYEDDKNENRLTVSLEFEPTKKLVCCINSFYLNPVAQGHELKCWYLENNSLSPIVFEILDDITFYLIMPMKMN